jgi:predicted dehydrogenase
MSDTTRWGILGPGHIAEKFADALSFVEGSTLQAVASRDLARASVFAKRFGASSHYGKYESLASDEQVDVIYIATPHGFHAEQAILCLERGKPLLIEKPLALSASEAEMVMDMACKKGLFVMEAMWTRFLPVIRTAEKLIADKTIGDLKAVVADFCFNGDSRPEGRLYNKRLGGGSLLDVGVYPLSLFQLLLGNPEQVISSCQLSATGVDEVCQAILRYPGGKAAQMISGIIFNSSVTADIIGTEGMIHIPGRWYRSDTLTVDRPGQTLQVLSCPIQYNGFEYQIREVMKCLGEKRLESTLLPHSFILDRFQTMDLIREQCGIHYV